MAEIGEPIRRTTVEPEPIEQPESEPEKEPETVQWTTPYDPFDLYKRP